MPEVKLHPYQARMHRFAMQRLVVDDLPGVGLLAAPGLGKTVTLLTIAQSLVDLGEASHILLVAPLRVCKLVWPAEVAKWGFPLSVRQLNGRTNKMPRDVANIELINFESLHTLEQHTGRWDTLVVDESPKLKNWTAKRTKALRRMLPSFRKRLILTGTPVSEGVQDIFSSIFLLDDGKRLGKNITVFRSRFMRQGSQNGPGGFWADHRWEARDHAAEEIIERISDIVIRVDESELEGMPELNQVDVLCELPSHARAGYNKLKRELFLQLETGDIFAANSASAYAKVKQYAGGAVYDENKAAHEVHDAKLEALADLSDELGDRPLLTFFTYKHERDRLLKLMPKARVIDGDSEKRKLQTTVDGWVNCDYTRLICQSQSTSHGLNLQGECADVAFFGLPDSLDVYDQAFRRVHRQGAAHKHTRVHRLLTVGTVDEIVRDRIDNKFANQYEFLDALKNHARSAT